jgi:DNA-binding MarR family transcriptional regulator
MARSTQQFATGLAVMVELQDMRWAITASQHRSLRQAAETLNVRQSTLSRRLRDMEYRLGAELFERTNGGTRTTVVGRELLQTARRIVEETDAALARLRSCCRGESGRLTIGVYTSFSIGNLRATLTEHHRRFPDVDVHTIDGGHDRLLGELASEFFEIPEAEARQVIRDTVRRISDGWRDALRHVGVSGALARDYEPAFVNDQTEVALGI